MKYNVLTIPPFDKQLKRLTKKYASLKKEYSELLGSLEQGPQQGVPLGNSCYKIRLAIAAKNKGKSGGARIISFVESTIVSEIIIEQNNVTVFLISIYDKSEAESISNIELKELIKHKLK